MSRQSANLDRGESGRYRSAIASNSTRSFLGSGLLSSANLRQVLQAEVVIIANKAVSKNEVAKYMRADQIVIEANVDKSRHGDAGACQGIC